MLLVGVRRCAIPRSEQGQGAWSVGAPARGVSRYHLVQPNSLRARLERLFSHRRSSGSIPPGFSAFDHRRRVCAVLCPGPAMRLSCSSFNVLLGRSSCATMSKGTRVPSASCGQLCAVHTSLPFCSALRWVYSFLTDSPLSSMRCAPCTMRSQIASAMVGSPIVSCQLDTGS